MWLSLQRGRVPPPALRVLTLGRWEVRQGPRRIEKRALRQRRAGELLAVLLLVPGRRLSAEEGFTWDALSIASTSLTFDIDGFRP